MALTPWQQMKERKNKYRKEKWRVKIEERENIEKRMKDHKAEHFLNKRDPCRKQNL